MIIPSKDVVGKDDPREISLTLQFTHPFEGGPQMELVKPEKFGVVVEGKVTDLTGTLKEKKVEGKSTWETTYKISQTRGLHLLHAAQALLGARGRQVHHPLYQSNSGRFRRGSRVGQAYRQSRGHSRGDRPTFTACTAFMRAICLPVRYSGMANLRRTRKLRWNSGAEAKPRPRRIRTSVK